MEKNYIKQHNDLQAEIYCEILKMVSNSTYDVFFMNYNIVPECVVMAFDNDTRTYNEYVVESLYIKDVDVVYIKTNSTKKLDLDSCDVLSLAKLHDTMVMQLAELEKNFLENDERLNVEPTHSKRMFIVPNDCLTDDIEDNDFITLAWHKGLVLTPEEYAKAHNNFGLGVCVPEHSTIKIFDFEDTIVEYCPHCDNEVVLDSRFEVQICPICKNKIAPCNLCTNCVKDCPLKRIVEGKE